MKRAIILYFISEFFISFGIGMVQYTQPFFYAAANIGDAKIGYLIAINAFFGGVGAIVASPIADRVGASRVCKLGTLLIALGYFAISIGHSFHVWILTTAIAGVGGSMLASTENVVLNNLLTGREKAHLISRFTALYMSIIGIGIVCAGLLVPALGLQGTMVVGSAIALIAPIVRYFVRVSDTTRSHWLSIPSRPLVFMAIYAILFGIAGGLFNPFATLILKLQYGAGNLETSMAYAVSIFMIALGSFFVRPLIRHIRQGATLFLSFSMSAMSTLLLLIATTLSSFVAVYFLVTAVAAIPPPVIDAMFLDFVHTSEYSQMFGMRVFGVRVGNAVGAAAGGSLLKHNAYQVLIIASAVMFVISYAYLLFVRRPLLQRRATLADREPESGIRD